MDLSDELMCCIPDHGIAMTVQSAFNPRLSVAKINPITNKDGSELEKPATRTASHLSSFQSVVQEARSGSSWRQGDNVGLLLRVGNAMQPGAIAASRLFEGAGAMESAICGGLLSLSRYGRPNDAGLARGSTRRGGHRG